MKKAVFYLFIVFSMALKGVSQQDVVIGTGTLKTSILPFCNSYNYSWTEMIYSASDIPASGVISFISFYLSEPSTSPCMFTSVHIYLGTTTRSAHSSNTDWQSLSDLTEVYSATNMTTPTTSGWQDIELDVPFPYDGTENLVIVVGKSMTSYNTSVKYNYTSTTGACIYRCHDNNTSYADYPGSNSGYVISTLPNLKLTIDNENDCQAVTKFTVSDITSTDVTVSWNAPEDAGSYILQYKTNSQNWDNDSVVTELLTDTMYDFYGMLAQLTTYNVRVAHLCNDGDTSNWRNLTFTTGMELVSLPYTSTFDTNDFWLLNNGTLANYWAMNVVDGHNALFVTNNGITPTYSYTRCSVSAEKSFLIGDASTYVVSFDLKCGGKYNDDYLKLFLAPSSQVYAADIVSPWVLSSAPYAANFLDYFYMTGTPNSTPYNINLTNGKTIHFDIRMNNPIENPDSLSVAKLVFGWYNESGSTYDHGIQPGATITNLRMKVETCFPLSGLSVSNVQTHSADLTWDLPEDGPNNYVIQYVKAGLNWDDASITTVNAQDTSITLTGLQPNTDYWVRVACNCGNDTSVWIKESFTTLCEYIDSLPFFCDFSVIPNLVNHPIPVCWERGDEYCCDPSVHYGAMNFWVPNTIALPHLNREIIDLTSTEVSFYAKSVENNGKLIVGVMTSSSDVSTFVAIDTLNLSPSFSHYAIPLSNYLGDGDLVAFKNIDYSDIYVDDVYLDYHLSCPRPAEQASSNPTYSSVDLTWTGTSQSYNVYYKIKGDSVYSLVPNISLDNNGVFTLSGLTSGTIYEWHISALCDDGTEAKSHEISNFGTLCYPIMELPVTWDFEYYNNETLLPECWKSFSGSNAIKVADSHSGTHVLRFYHNDNAPNIVVLPKVENSLYPIDNLQVRFFAKNVGDYSDWHVQVIGGVIMDPSYSSTFEPNDTIDVIGAAGGSYLEYTLRLADFLWGDGYPALKFVRVSGPMWLYIDDLTLEVVDSTLLPVMPSVTTQEANNVSQTTATLNAAVNNPDNLLVSSAGFEWRNISDSSFTHIDCPLSNGVIMTDLNGLTANMTYSYRAFITYFGTTDYGEELFFATLREEDDTVGIPVIGYLSNSITLYPTPANDYINVQCTMNNVHCLGVEVIDVYGKVINTMNVTENPTRINVSGLANGMYFVRVTTDEGVVTKTFIKR